MRSIQRVPELNHLWQRVLHYASIYNRTLPEIRFFVLEAMEFVSLLEKHVYPASPPNIWEGRNMIGKKYRIESGQESALYYEVVQTGEPSYAYLNHTNSPMIQASVMAHVVGHCEFSMMNVLHDSKKDRTEYVMYLVNQIQMARQQMGEVHYGEFWNACESIIPLTSEYSQFNLNNSIETEVPIFHDKNKDLRKVPETKTATSQLYSSTLDSLFQHRDIEMAFKSELQKKMRTETLSRKGFKIKAPVQDVAGFLRYYAPLSRSERQLFEYLYTVQCPHEFVIRTQIMNEGWAMYWEKKLMTELFKEKSVSGIIDYCKVFSGVCYPRPYFMRNPYHVGFHLWCHIEEMYRKGKISIEYEEEKDLIKKDLWNKPGKDDPVNLMTHLVETITDYEFLRRYLSFECVEKFYLNRLPKKMAHQMGFSAQDVVRESDHYVWVNPEMVKEEMLGFYTHFHQPRIYVLDDDFMDGGLLLFHRDDGKPLKQSWIEPTLKNINYIWRGAVHLISQRYHYHYLGNKFEKKEITEIRFETILERMKNFERPVSHGSI